MRKRNAISSNCNQLILLVSLTLNFCSLAQCPNGFDVLYGELYLGTRCVLLYSLGAATAWDWNVLNAILAKRIAMEVEIALTILVLGKNPSKRDLGGRSIVFICNCFDLVRQIDVLVEVLFREAW